MSRSTSKLRLNICLDLLALSLSSFIFVYTFRPSYAHAVKMDETTHDMVIQRLEIGVQNMDKTDPERTGVLLRLANLYADRARLKAMNEMDRNCATCKEASADRSKAISLYNEVLGKTEKEKQGPILLQLAHLNSLNDRGAKSLDLYQGILKAKRSAYSSEVRAIANSSIGEHYFRKGDFKTALRYFEAARRENLKTRALVEYRIAWCQLNLGQNEKAIGTLKRLLQNPELLATQTTDGKSVDPSFVQDASHDLAQFLAHSRVGMKEVELLRSLSPETARKNNLYTLANECDRLGKKNEALVVWAAYVDEGGVKTNEKLEVQIRVAKIYYDMNKLELAANGYEKAMSLWKEKGCQGNEDLCKELKSRVRQMATAWNKAQKDHPTTNLFRVYVAYAKVFTDDVEMLQWAAVVGRDLKRHKEAAELFHRAALQINGRKEYAQILEGCLLGEIEMAEAEGDIKAKEVAYNFYLQQNPNGAKAFEARYQRAQVYTSSGRSREAFSEYDTLALQPGKDNRDLKIKSADLALDSLVALKDDATLQAKAQDYARVFPERRDEYMKISRKASLNIVAANLNNDKSADRSDYKENLAALEKIDMSGADDAEKIKFYKNKIIIAQKALALESVNEAGNRLLMVKSLSAEDREWTMEQKVWAAELQLNFGLAYQLTKQMKTPRLSKADRELRLALLAELSGLSPRRHNEEFLRLNRNLRAGNLVRISLIKDSRAPWSELERHLSYLRQTPDLLAGITLETFARKRDYNRAGKILKSHGIRQFPAGQTLARHLDLKDLYAFDARIRAHRLRAYNDSVMQKTLKERLDLVAQSERLAQSALQKHDWTLEILGLSQMARENRRLYHDILGLPIPRKLNAQQRRDYQALLKTKSDPYLARAEKVESQLTAMWNQPASIQNLQATYMTTAPELQGLYRDEIKGLAYIAPPGTKNRLLNLLNTPFRRPSQRDIMMARRDLQTHPFDVSKAENLRELEASSGHPAMAAYLDERISQLKRGKTL